MSLKSWQIFPVLPIALLVPIVSHSPPATADHIASPIDGPSRVRNDQWHLKYLKINQAHQISRGEGVTVAVTDTGVDPHQDLRGNLLPGTDLVADTGDGRQDLDSHGTSMAGLIAAHGRTESTGALGIAPKAKIIPVRFQLSNQLGDMDTLAHAIEYSVSRGAQVISVSAGGPPSVELQRAVAAAVSANVVIVAAIGNLPRQATTAFPAAYPGVIAVGGIDRTGRASEVSIPGPEVDLAAPATDIFSTSINGNYSKGDGTSGATAIVAGAVALIRARYPSLPADEVVHRLTATAIDKGPPGRDDQYGYGVIDIVAALTADVPPLGFDSPTTEPPPPTDQADGPRDDSAATIRGLLTLGAIVAIGATWAVVARRRRHGDDPPPRISR